MGLKTTQIQLKTGFRKEIKDLKYAIYGKCFDCMGFYPDGYIECEIETCNLYPYRLKGVASRCSKSLASFLRVSKKRIQE